jgi:hypothetical protein
MTFEFPHRPSTAQGFSPKGNSSVPKHFKEPIAKLMLTSILSTTHGYIVWRLKKKTTKNSNGNIGG